MSLSNEIKWVDEEGLKARLDAEAELRTRLDELAARFDEFEEANGLTVATSGPLGHGGSMRPLSASAASARKSPMRSLMTSSAAARSGSFRLDNPVVPVSRETLVKHVRVRDCGVCVPLCRSRAASSPVRVGCVHAPGQRRAHRPAVARHGRGQGCRPRHSRLTRDGQPATLRCGVCVAA